LFGISVLLPMIQSIKERTISTWSIISILDMNVAVVDLKLTPTCSGARTVEPLNLYLRLLVSSRIALVDGVVGFFFD
jgi:hypothetical protein